MQGGYECGVGHVGVAAICVSHSEAVMPSAGQAGTILIPESGVKERRCCTVTVQVHCMAYASTYRA